jgi:predicted lipid carrier protein YhbT
MLMVLMPLVAGSGRLEGLEGIGTLHVHVTDTAGEWLVEPAAGALTVTREHAKGDAALRGPAQDLLLRLYNRGDAGEVIGEVGVLDRWRAAVRF